MQKVIHPVEFYALQPEEQFVFLAWPIRGTDVWRDEAMKLISEANPDKRIVFASPDRVNDKKIYTPGYEDFVLRQRQWEQYYIRKAVEQWVVLFWLEEQKLPLPEIEWIQQKAYGAISHIELGEIITTHPNKTIVGIHPKYKERSTIINDLKQSNYLDLSVPYDPKKLSDFVVSETLADTCLRTGILLNNLK